MRQFRTSLNKQKAKQNVLFLKLYLNFSIDRQGYGSTYTLNVTIKEKSFSFSSFEIVVFKRKKIRLLRFQLKKFQALLHFFLGIFSF